MSETDASATPVTRWLAQWRAGDAQARDRLIGSLYPELRDLAGRAFRRERSDHTLQPTALLNEAWLRMGGTSLPEGVDRRELLTIAARLMREILIDHARGKRRAKRDGGERISLSGLPIDEATGDVDLLDLEAALARLERLDAEKARVIELRYFGGLSIEETASAMGQSPATVKRHWKAARLWLRDALG
jgi:RNA polymerase sigma factor (TIGR02999 family)